MKKKPWYHRIRVWFVTGLLILAPAVMTGFIIWKGFNTLDAILKPLFQRLFDFYIPGTGLVALTLLILLTGMAARNYIGHHLIRIWNRILDMLPIVNKIYPYLKQIGETLFMEDDDRELFKRAVLLEYPRKGIWSIGFITSDTSGILQQKLPEDTWSVFIPTTPNPTSGVLLFVPRESVIPLDISVSDALRTIIAGGSINPENHASLPA